MIGTEEVDQAALTEIARDAIHGAFTRRKNKAWKLRRRRQFADGDAGFPEVPEGASDELQTLAKTSIMNMCGVAYRAFSHGLSVAGFRSPDAVDNDPAWAWWQSQDLDARQAEVHDATGSYGWSFVSVLPSELTKADARIWSPLDVDAVYTDPRHDRFPESATLWRRVESGWSVFFVDETHVTEGFVKTTRRKVLSVEMGDRWEHGAKFRGVPVCPVVKFPNERIADDCDPVGEVEPLIPLQKSINGVNFERLVASRFSVFNQKVIIGWTAPRDQVLKASNSRVWTFDDHPSDVKVETLPASPITPYNELLKELKEQVALEASIPIYQATGSVANVSENTVAMVDKAYESKLSVKKDLLGEAWETVLRLAVAMTGGAEPSESAEVIWRDTRARSMSVVVDGVQKLAAQGVPIEDLIDLVPGISQQRADAIRDGIRRRSSQLLIDRLDPQAAQSGVAGESTVLADLQAEKLRAEIDNIRAQQVGALRRAGTKAESAAKKAGMPDLEFMPGSPITIREPELS